jgi:hypothetical protein
MKLVDQKEAIKSLKDAFNSRNLTIYLGAGVSIPSGLPSWEQLVLLLYFRTLKADIDSRVYPNYLLAISEWLLKNKNEPLDIILRKLKISGWDENTFLRLIRETLYTGFNMFGEVQRPLVDGNKTLISIINYLCIASSQQNHDLKAMKYNEKLKRSNVKVEENEYGEVVDILKEISKFESETFNTIYEDMGLEVLLYDDHDEVADFIEAIAK